MKSKVINWSPVVLWMLVVFAFSSMPQIKVSQFFFWDFVLKKTAHVSEYAILYALIFRATGKKYLLAFILTVLYAASDEFHQSFVPGRTSSIRDIVIDFSGSNIAAYTLWKLHQIRPSRQKK